MIDLKRLKILAVGLILAGLIIGFIPRGSEIYTYDECGSAFRPKSQSSLPWCLGDEDKMRFVAYGSLLLGAGLITYLWLRKDEEAE